MVDELRDAVHAAAARLEVREAVDEVYRLLADAIAIRKPICTASGRCCRFEEFGHRLYLTTMELAKFVADLSAGRNQAGGIHTRQTSTLYPSRSLAIFADRSNHGKNDVNWDGRGCPFQIDGLCGVHEIRPFGCRIFFCDPTSVDWQHDQYERHHARLRNLHDELSVPYHYVEWRFALKSLGLAGLHSENENRL